MRIQNEKVSITFQYDIEEHVMEKPIRLTTCKLISVKPNQKTEKGKLIAEAQVRQNPREPDCKFLARKYALTAVLKKARYGKKRRAAIWTEYLAKIKVPAGSK